MNNKFNIIFIILVIFAVFLPSLKNDFVWDDKYLITGNPYIKSYNCIPQVFKSHLYKASNMQSNFYRPLQALSYMLDYSIWKLNPYGYHLTNLLLHILNSILIYAVIAAISISPLIALIAALMFSVSPVISGVTYYISARADLLMAFFIMLSLWLFIKYLQSDRKIFYITSIAVSIFALLSKEMAVILPFLLLIEVSRNPVKKHSIVLLPYFLILGTYIFLRMTFLNFADFSAIQGFSLGERLLTDFKVAAIYIQLLLFPSNLHMQRAVTAATPFGLNLFAAILLVLAVLFIVIRLKRYDGIFLYGALWFFITLLPVLNIYPISVFLHEMWLYLPSVGFYLFLSAFILKFMAKKIGAIITSLMIIIYIAYYIGVTFCYGHIWKDSISLFTNDLKYAKDNLIKIDTYNNIAVAYAENSRINDALRYYKKCLALTKSPFELYNNMGIAYVKSGRPVLAIRFFKGSISIKKDYLLAYCNLAKAYDGLGFKKRAVYFLKKALSIQPDSKAAYGMLGEIYLGMGEINDAETNLQRAIRISDDNSNIYILLGQVYMLKNNYKGALTAYKKALRLGFEPTPSYYNELGYIYMRSLNFKNAEMCFKESLKINNAQAGAYNNLGNLYYIMKKFDLAFEQYRKALALDEKDSGILRNIKDLKTELKKTYYGKYGKK